MGLLEFILGTMNSVKFTDILAINLFSSASEMCIRYFLMQKDDDPKHTSAFTRQFLKDKNVKVLDLLAQSLDLNPIENLFGIVKGTLLNFR